MTTTTQRDITTMTTPNFADGSDLPEYTPGGSLHRPGDQPDDERVHVTQTSDAELIADLWGVIFDFELNTGAISMRFQKFVRDNYGDEFAEKLLDRSVARFSGDEPGQIDTIGDHLPRDRRYRFGHTGMIPADRLGA